MDALNPFENFHILLQFRLRFFFFLLQTKFKNLFPENSMFGRSGKLGQTENIFSLTVK